MPRMVSTSSLCIAATLMASASMNANAWPQFLAMIPNSRTVSDGSVSLGHAEGTLARNKFGLAFDVNRNWSTVCEADSDGDGQTNGQELGDPCCVWTVGKDWLLQRVNGTSNPGNKSSTADPSLWKDVNCTLVIRAAAANSTASSTGSGASSASAPAPASATSSASTMYVAGASSLLVTSVLALI